MRNFILKALEKLPKLDKEQIQSIFLDIAYENERLEVVLESMPDGIVVCDNAHNVILFNKAAERQLQLPYQDIYERKLWSVLPDKEIADFLKKSLYNEDKVIDKEYTIDLLGVRKILYISLMPLVKNGEIQGSLVLVKDVTERRKRDARLRRAESLAALTTLAAGVAHEIKNPLGSISIHIQLIQKSLQYDCAGQSENIHNHLEIINEEINRLNSIVVDFLFAVRPMATKLEDREINEIIIDVIELVEVELKQAKIVCKKNLSRKLPKVSVDEKYIKQALLNLIKNAIAAMPEGGTLSVSSEYRGDSLVVSVGDTGMGISDEHMEKIFEPYFTTKDFGSGLGLTVVYKIIKEHFGDITVKSKEHEGTVFSLFFPIPQKEQRLLSWRGNEE